MAEAAECDLFLSYSSADRAAVLDIRTPLQALGVETFLDRDNLPPGQSWIEELQYALGSCRGVAVFVGPSELGAWQWLGAQMVIDRQVLAGGSLVQDTAGEVVFSLPVLHWRARERAKWEISAH